MLATGLTNSTERYRRIGNFLNLDRYFFGVFVILLGTFLAIFDLHRSFLALAGPCRQSWLTITSITKESPTPEFPILIKWSVVIVQKRRRDLFHCDAGARLWRKSTAATSTASTTRKRRCARKWTACRIPAGWYLSATPITRTRFTGSGCLCCCTPGGWDGSRTRALCLSSICISFEQITSVSVENGRKD